MYANASACSRTVLNVFCDVVFRGLRFLFPRSRCSRIDTRSRSSRSGVSVLNMFCNVMFRGLHFLYPRSGVSVLNMFCNVMFRGLHFLYPRSRCSRIDTRSRCSRSGVSVLNVLCDVMFRGLLFFLSAKWRVGFERVFKQIVCFINSKAAAIQNKGDAPTG
jgi:hypothetical protein